MLQHYGDNATLHFCVIAKRFKLRRKVIASHSCHSRLFKIAIAFYSYRSGLIGNVISFYSYRSEHMKKAITYNAVTFCSNVAYLYLLVRCVALFSVTRGESSGASGLQL